MNGSACLSLKVSQMAAQTTVGCLLLEESPAMCKAVAQVLRVPWAMLHVLGRGPRESQGGAFRLH